MSTGVPSVESSRIKHNPFSALATGVAKSAAALKEAHESEDEDNPDEAIGKALHKEIAPKAARKSGLPSGGVKPTGGKPAFI